MGPSPLSDIASILQRRLNVQLAAHALECGKAATKDEKANFTTKVTKHALSKAEGSTKLRSLKISVFETFVAGAGPEQTQSKGVLRGEMAFSTRRMRHTSFQS